MKARAPVVALAVALVLVLGSGCRASAPQPPVPPYELTTVFTGQHAFRAERLRSIVLAELARLAGTRPTKADVDDAAFALELAYRTRGFPFVRVDYELIELPEAPPCARFTIDEGPLTLVGELRLEGFSALDPVRARAFLGAAAEGGPYDEDRIEAGVAALRQEYLRLGHLRVSIADPEVEFDAERDEAVVTIRVGEGPASLVREITFEGGLPQFAAHEQALRRKLLGQIHGTEVELELQNSLREAHLERGYPDVEVEVDTVVDETSGDVRLTVRTTPGERVRIAAVVARGNVRTKLSAIQSLLGIEAGDVYDPEARREGFSALYATGLFESLSIELEGTGPERTLVVEVEEARFVQIRMEPGWGSYEGPRVLLAIDEINFRGLGQRLSLEGTASPKAQGAKLSWIDPRFLDTHFAAETTFFTEQREEPSFSFSRIGASFFLRRRWSELWSSSLGYEIRPTNVNDDLQETPFTPLALDGESTGLTDDANTAALSVGVVLDDRDNVLLPTRGQRASARFEWADDGIGSQVEFCRAQLEYTRLFRLGQESVLASSARTGVIARHGTTDEIPLPERFFNGGESSVRSFEEDELGPVDLAGKPIGGESSTTLGLELRRQIVGNLAGALFVDAGNVTEERQDYLDFPDFRYALGVGLRYLLPVGPVRIDFGLNPDPKDIFAGGTRVGKEDEYALHFSVGFPF